MEPAVQNSVASEGAGKRVVLIVEDEKSIARALQLKLEREGFEVELAGDGEQAIKKIDEGTYALVLLDLVMPKVDGFKVLEHITSTKPGTQIFVLSNLSQEDDAAKAKQLGAKEFFIKSNTPLTKIVEHVKSVLG